MKHSELSKAAIACSIALGLAIMGCSDAAEAPLQPEGVSLEANRSGQPGVTVIDLGTAEEAGTSKLVRTPNGVNYRLSTSGLEPGHAYTLWIVIFNDPAGCVDPIPGPCGMGDIVNDDARPDMMFAAGTVVGGSGRATFAGRRAVGDLSGSANDPVGVPAYGLEDPAAAVIWLVVHDHGPKLPPFMPDMIQTIDGGCTDAGVPEAGVSSPWNDYDGPAGVGAFGERGPNGCASVQLAVHAS